MPGGTVTLNPQHGSELTLILNAPPDRSGGVGGWQTVDRARRRPGKWWQGTPDETISLDCTLDIDAINGPSIERRLVVLRTMGKPRRDTDGEPPTIQLAGDVEASDRQLTWVMSDLKYGDRLFLPDGTLRRQQVSVDLEGYTEIQDIAAVRVSRTRIKGKRRRHVTHAHTKETLRAIALRELGDAGRWKDLRKWNPKLKHVDPDYPLRRGTHVVVR